jgi:hypothetical protein
LEGNLYVLELAKNDLLGTTDPADTCDGTLIRVTPHGDHETVREGEGRILPGSVAVSGHGDIYISNNSIDRVAGKAVRLP